MNVRPDLPTTKAGFLRFIEKQEGGKYEWDGKRGVVVMMVDVTRAHGRVVRNVLRLLEAGPNAFSFDFMVEAFGVEIGDSTRFPDIVVEPRSDGPPTERRARAPLVLVEVLSPSSLYVDLRDKPLEYLRLPTLQSYLVFAQDAARAWVWQRDAQGQFPERPEEIEGLDASVAVPALSLPLPLAEVYRGVL